MPDGRAPEDMARGDMAATPTGYLRVRAGRIVDSTGREVRLTGVSWFGLETDVFAPHGLWARPLPAILDQIKALGYNFIRVPFSNQLLDAASRPRDTSLTANPDLRGLSGVQILDRLVQEAGRRGLKIVLVRQQPTVAGPTALWYTAQVPESRFTADWVALAERYLNNPTVVGCDLHNEPHEPASWGMGDPRNDWRLGAERTGNAILARNPDLLIIVQGVGVLGSDSYWWGGNLRNARVSPVRLPADRLVYSAHDYPPSVAPQEWFRDPNYPNNLPAIWDRFWGFLMKDPDPEKNTPVLLGEFGTPYMTDPDRRWFQTITRYIRDNRMSFAYWSLNPSASGLLQNDWSTVNNEVQMLLRPLLAPPIP
jgi:endoglucanase